jgi:pimeloyl-ACP methyl ester carboxylesterase
MIPVERRIGVGTLLEGEGPLTIAARVYGPARLAEPPVVLFCLPGGALTQRYFDLRVPADSSTRADAVADAQLVESAASSFSFAAAMTSRGYIVVSLDHLGVGASTRPRNGFELTPDLLAGANARAMTCLREELVRGELVDGWGPQPELISVGVGHSMGGMLTAMQQAQYPQHAGVVLMGFSARGLAPALSAQEAAFAQDPGRIRENLVRLARLRSPGEPYPQIGPTPQAREFFAGSDAERAGVEALREARDGLLVTAGLFSMIPGSCAPECSRVAVPVLLVVGDRDIAGPPHAIPADFPGSRDVTLCVLPNTGHCHFLFASRERLFHRVARWIDSVVRA